MVDFIQNIKAALVGHRIFDMSANPPRLIGVAQVIRAPLKITSTLYTGHGLKEGDLAYIYDIWGRPLYKMAFRGGKLIALAYLGGQTNGWQQPLNDQSAPAPATGGQNTATTSTNTPAPVTTSTTTAISTETVKGESTLDKIMAAKIDVFGVQIPALPAAAVGVTVIVAALLLNKEGK